jgi:hypothetical protein
MPNRRDFLLLRPSTTRPFELSCERLYMRYLDSIDECNTVELLEGLAQDLRDAKTVRLTATGWLTREDFRSWIDPLLDSLRARGVQIRLE